MLYVVTGAPAAGKSTWVRSHAKPGDLRFDTDALTNVITGREPGKHHHDTKSRTVAAAARQAGIDAALPVATECDVYVIHSNLSKDLEAKYRARGAQFVIVDPGEEENLRRCAAHRPGYKQRQVRAWYARRAEWPRDALIVSGSESMGGAADLDPEPTPPKTTTERGLGWEHQRKREALLAVHRDGAPCWWCARPMYRDKARNFDGQALAADHIQARANGGTAAGRLLHGSCNSSRGDGSRDALRPALAAPGEEPTPHPDSPPAAPLGPAPALSPAADYEPATVYDWPSL